MRRAREEKGTRSRPAPGDGSSHRSELRLVQTLAIGLKIADDLRDRGDQLAHDLIDVLRAQLPLAKVLHAAERGLERLAVLAELRLQTELAVRIAKSLSELVRIGILPAERLATKTLLAQAAMHRGQLHRRLSLLDGAEDLRQNRQKLAHDFMDVLRAQLALLTEAITERRQRLLGLCKDLRQEGNDLAHDLAHILL